MPVSDISIFTIGHSNVTTYKLIELLKSQDVKILVDVRSFPYSKYNPQFNKEQLRRAVQKAGLKYHYAGESLGGRPDNPCCYKNGKIPDGRADYLHLVDYKVVMNMPSFQEGISQLLDLAKNERVVIMCSEEDPNKCHRHHLIGKYLVDQGIEVLHIRAEGELIRDQLLVNLTEKPSAEQLNLFED